MKTSWISARNIHSSVAESSSLDQEDEFKNLMRAGIIIASCHSFDEEDILINFMPAGNLSSYHSIVKEDILFKPSYYFEYIITLLARP